MKRNISIEVKVTDRCNLNCFHCMNEDGYNIGKDLDVIQFIERLLQWMETGESAGHRIDEIRMTGGEPLLNLPAVIDLAKGCKSLGIRAGINTNALLLDVDNTRQLKEAGIETVKVAFNATDENILRKLHGPGASHKSMLEGIHNAIESEFRVIIRFTLNAFNRHQLIPCYHLAREMGAEKFQIKPLIRSGRAIGSGAFLSPEDIFHDLNELAGVVNGPFGVPEILCWPPDKAAGLPFKVCGSINKIYFSPDCEATSCNYLLRPGTIGNLKENTLESILNKRRFHDYEIIDGHRIIRGCPQIEYFNATTEQMADKKHLGISS